MPYRIAIIVAATALGLLLGVPYGLYSWATSTLENEPCAAGVAEAPSEGFYQAVSVLDAVSVLPWFTDLAGVRSANASTHCLVVYQDACDVPRDEAVAAAHAALSDRLGATHADAAGEEAAPNDEAHAAAARDTDWQHHVSADAVDALCDGWQDWRMWLDESGLNASAACPICG